MSIMSQVGALFASFWNAFLLPHPVLGISFASLFIGAFIVKFSITLLFPLLGLGSKASNGLTKRAKRSRKEDSE